MKKELRTSNDAAWGRDAEGGCLRPAAGGRGIILVFANAGVALEVISAGFGGAGQRGKLAAADVAAGGRDGEQSCG